MEHERPEKPLHPDAKLRGKKVEITKVIPPKEGETTSASLKLTILMDTRDPSTWKERPSLTLWLQPLIEQTVFDDLQALVKHFGRLHGPLQDMVESAVGQIDPDFFDKLRHS